MIRCDQVSFAYYNSRETLNELSFSVKAGECILLCGESGCGKTTVTKLINGLIPHFTDGCFLKGQVEAAGMRVADTELYEMAKRIGSVFQNPKSQFFSLDTDSELAFGLENQGMPPQQMKERLKYTIENLQIQNLQSRNIFSLSGGEKQMLAFASVYAMDPVIYVLDEPTANLDETVIRRLRELLIELKRQGHTIVIAEHRLYFLRDLVDRAFYFKEGRLAECLTGEGFGRLTDRQRKEMGLRSLHEEVLSLPAARKCVQGSGLVIEDLSGGYKKEADVFQGLSFAACPGEVLAISGCNGSGKTTLMRCLCGLIRERSGRVLLDGKPLTAKDRRRESFLVMQDVNHQLFYDSVWNECQQAAGKEVRNIEEVLRQLDLLSLKERHPMSLSGGQKQRLAVAAALISGKRLLIFDEPTSGLDYRHMQQVRKVVRCLAEQGHIVLVVSHDKEFMQEACDRVLYIEEAKKW